MALSVTDITKAFSSGDVARSNLFKVKIPFLGRETEFKIKASQIPVAVVEKVPLSYMNKKINLAGDRSYEDWTVTVYVDADHNIRQQLIDWQNSAHAIGKDIQGDIPAQYKKQATITAIDRQGRETKSYNFEGVWPTNIAEIQMDWENNNQIATFDVTFQIDWWLPA